LTDRDVALIAAMNHPHITVYRRPKIALIATGDELVRPGTEPAPGQIVSSNAFALAALARNEGAEAIDLGIVPDSLDATMAAVEQAKNLKADVLMSSGGASVGDYDLIQKALVAKGMSLAFWRVALRPGRPVMHGDLGGMRVLGLPGNPVSAYVCAFLFLLPLIRRLSGRTDIQPITESALLGRDLGANDERTDYLRATLSRNPAGDVVATPHPLQDSSMLTPLAKADCLLIREPFAPAAHSGSLCTVVKFGL
jgi:molybdopterin molybdotransferase